MIRVTYNMGQDVNDNSGMKDILNDLIRRPFVILKSHPENDKFEILEVEESKLRTYCEIKKINFWDLILDSILLSYQSIQQEFNFYGKKISKVELGNIKFHVRIEANKDILERKSPFGIVKNSFDWFQEISENRIRFTLIKNYKYFNEQELLIMNQFKHENKDLEINFI